MMIPLHPNQFYRHRLWVGVLVFLTLVFSISTTVKGQSVQKNPQAGSKNGFPIPGLGENPWIIDSILGQRKPFGGGLNPESILKNKDQLKEWIDQQQANLSPDQKQLLENLIKNAGEGKNIDRNRLNQLFGQMFPEGKSPSREQLQNILGNKGESFGSSFPGIEKQGQKNGSERANNPYRSGPPNPQMTGPDSSSGNSLDKTMDPPPGPNQSNNTNSPMEPLGNQQGQSNSGTIPVSNPVSSGEKVLKTLFPLGLDKLAKPLAKDFVKWGAKWSSNWKLPQGWGEGFKKTLGQIRLPATPPVGGPRVPNIAPESLPRTGFLVLLIGGGVFIGVLVLLGLKKAGLGTPGGLLGSFKSISKGNSLISAMESAVVRIGGRQGALGNHVMWKLSYSPVMVERGLSPDSVDQIFDHYVRVKYRGLPLDSNTENQIVSALHCI